MLDQFKEGICTLGVIDAIKQHPSIMEPLFVVNGQTRLTAGLCCNIILFQLCDDASLTTFVFQIHSRVLLVKFISLLKAVLKYLERELCT